MGPAQRFGMARKFLLAFGLLIAVLVAITLVGLKIISDSTDRAVFAGEQTQELDDARHAYEVATEMQVLDGRRPTADVAQRQRIETRLDELDARLRDQIVELNATAEIELEKRQGAQIERAFSDYRAVRDRIGSPAREGQASHARLLKALAANGNTHAGEAREGLAAAKDAKNGDRRQLIVIALLALLVGIAGAVWLTRQTLPRLREYIGFAGEIAEGDLTRRLEPRGNDELTELAHSLNQMVERLAELSRQVQEGARAITSSANEILATVSQHTVSANEQSAAITQTSTSVEEVRVAAEQSAAKADEVAEQAETSVAVGDEGSRAVEGIVAGMGDIQERVDAIADDILSLSEQTQRIGEITRTVNDLADQSNLLAFNATIEAAKAGEQGKGFAVVADEVRNLAEQSKDAAAQVQAILGEIQKATNAAVMAAEQGTTTVKAGTERAERAGEIIAQLAEINREASHAGQQIAALARQQNIGMDQIASAMNETHQATDQFVAGARESQSAAEHLDEIARKLSELAAAYKV